MHDPKALPLLALRFAGRFGLCIHSEEHTEVPGYLRGERAAAQYLLLRSRSQSGG